jgi:hypothetical protein
LIISVLKREQFVFISLKTMTKANAKSIFEILLGSFSIAVKLEISTNSVSNEEGEFITTTLSWFLKFSFLNNVVIGFWDMFEFILGQILSVYSLVSAQSQAE